MQFISEGSSLFDQSPITLSTLRAGTLHLGRQQPLSLRPDQFLRLDPPGIGVITSLRADQGQLGTPEKTNRELARLQPRTIA